MACYSQDPPLLVITASLAAYPFAEYLLHFVKQPLGAKLIIYAPLEVFLGYIKVSVAAGFLLTSPLLLYEVKRFLQYVCRLRPRAAPGGTVATGELFFLGVVFCYVVILPVVLRFLLSYGGETITPGISVNKYLSLTLGLAAACGARFELPLITLVLHSSRSDKYRLLDPESALCGAACCHCHGSSDSNP